jgi:hypothetical protein
MIRVHLGSWQGLLVQLGKVKLLTWTHPTPVPAPQEGLRSSPKLGGCPRGSEGCGGRSDWMIRAHLRSWEGLLVQLGKVEPRTLTPPKPPPAPRGLKTQPQAVQTSIGVRRVR